MEKAEPTKPTRRKERARSNQVPGGPITPELLKEFRDLYEKEFGVDLWDEPVLEKALNLLQLFEAIYRPMPAKPEGPISVTRPDDLADDCSRATEGEGHQLRLF